MIKINCTHRVFHKTYESRGERVRRIMEDKIIKEDYVNYELVKMNPKNLYHQ